MAQRESSQIPWCATGKRIRGWLIRKTQPGNKIRRGPYPRPDHDLPGS